MKLLFASEWDVQTDTVLGSGGFGKVCAATGPDGCAAAAKFVPKEPGAARELLAVDLPESDHVVPVIDFGESGKNWVLIMPRAQESLDDRMKLTIELPEALDILGQVAQGLADLGGSIVHRDLKPRNILRLNGKWAICDFGISRYVEATTSQETRKLFFTAPYAAPEQWRNVRATPATDVYALGIIAFELCCGSRPFPGPSMSDYREQHLHGAIPPMALTSRMSGLITECLYKDASTRPPASNLVARFSSAEEESKQPGARLLAMAQQAVVESQAETARRQEVSRTEAETLTERAAVAESALKLIVGSLVEAISAQAPDATASSKNGGTEIHLGTGNISIQRVVVVSHEPWHRSNLPGFHVVAYSAIAVTQSANARGYRGRQHSLYYCDFAQEWQFAWYELGFMWHAFMSPSDRSYFPIALPPGNEAAGALGKTSSPFQLALAFQELRVGETDSFNDKWMGYLAQASLQELTEATEQPEPGQQIRGPSR